MAEDPRPTEQLIAAMTKKPTGKGIRYGGRQKGTPNRSRFYQKTVAEVCKRMGLDPVEALVRFVKNLDPATGEPYVQEVIVGKGDNAHIENIHGFTQEVRLGAAKELAAFVAPKRKAIEHSTSEKPQGPLFQVIPEDEAQAQQAMLEAEQNQSNEEETPDED